MASRYAPSASKDVEREMRKFKRGTLKSGRGGRGGRVKSRKQAIAIGRAPGRQARPARSRGTAIEDSAFACGQEGRAHTTLPREILIPKIVPSDQEVYSYRHTQPRP